MTKITTLDLNPFLRSAIGHDKLFERIVNQFDHASSNNYPPYNIVETGDNTYEVQIAVAGFNEGEIEITVRDSELIINGEKSANALPAGHIYRHQGISARKFIRTFSLAEYVEVVEAGCKDGILTVKLERKIPESAKPKSIAITYEK